MPIFSKNKFETNFERYTKKVKKPKCDENDQRCKVFRKNPGTLHKKLINNFLNKNVENWLILLCPIIQQFSSIKVLEQTHTCHDHHPGFPVKKCAKILTQL